MGGYKSRKTWRRGKAYPRKTHKIFLIICEDEKTSPIYFRSFNRRNSPLKIETPPSGGQSPDNLVSYTKRLLKSEYDFLDFEGGDAAWCVFDRDHFPEEAIKQAARTAGKSGIKVCFSNPCFEVWYLLHHVYYNSSLGNCSNAIGKLREFMPGYRKNVDYSKILKPLAGKAISNSKMLEKHHKENGTELLSRGSDPSTLVYTLVEEILRRTEGMDKD
ncbi:RloB family protein [Methanosarcina sp. Mfa9]|uniref:RloB family protein n=1 Tax=Methanosarcina sp. Mfa9 TaxID=3439063 RepID=UPI003F8315AE